MKSETSMMRNPIVGMVVLIAGLSSGPAAAYFHAEGNRSSWSAQGWRGTASGGDGSWSASGYRGGSASGGDGSWSAQGWRGGTASGGGGSWHADGAYGGTASGGGGYWHASSPYGTTAYGGYNRDYGGYDHYYGGAYSTYHPSTTVNYYGSGCAACGGWATAGAAAAGVATGAAIGAGYAAATTAYAMGAIYPVLPAGCVWQAYAQVYECDGTWFQASYGANGVYYRVVAAP
jgi:hypothetical protein